MSTELLWEQRFNSVDKAIERSSSAWAIAFWSETRVRLLRAYLNEHGAGRIL